MLIVLHKFPYFILFAEAGDGHGKSVLQKKLAKLALHIGYAGESSHR